MKKTKSKKSPKSKPRHLPQPKGKAKPVADPNNPYRPSSGYGVLFAEGSKDYIAPADLISKVASLTGKSEKVTAYSFNVVKARTSRSNGGRSCLIEEDGGTGKVKFIALKKPTTG